MFKKPKKINDDDQKRNKKYLSFVLEQFRGFKGRIFIHLLTLSIYVIMSVTLPYITKLMIDYPDRIYGFLVLLLSLILLTSISFRIYHYVVYMDMIPKLEKKISKNLFVKMMNHDYDFYKKHLSGDMSKKRTNVIDEIQSIYILIFDGFFLYMAMTVVSFFGFLTLPLKYSLLIGFWLMLFFVLVYLYKDKLHDASVESADIEAKSNGFAMDVVSNILFVKLFNRFEYENSNFDDMNEKNIRAKVKFEKIYYIIFSAYGAAFASIMALSIYFMYHDYYAGLITVGDIVLFLNLSNMLVSRLWQIADYLQRFLKSRSRIVSGLEVLLDESDREDNSLDCKKIDKLEGSIKFDNVDFSYDKNKVLFENLNVDIKAGEKVGLIGYSGGGKTTFISLILKLYEPNNGKILIDGMNLQDIDVNDFVSVIPQDISLFHRSIFENIRYGKLDATKEEVISAAKMAQAHDFIEAMPDGYHTLVGEKGGKLSGGQKQRLMLARAFLKKAKIIILDEVTSQLDTINEERIQQNIVDLMKDSTVIVIAHRLSTLNQMNRLLVFDDGKIVESGTHQELLDKKGHYYRLYNKQVK